MHIRNPAARLHRGGATTSQKVLDYQRTRYSSGCGQVPKLAGHHLHRAPLGLDPTVARARTPVRAGEDTAVGVFPRPKYRHDRHFEVTLKPRCLAAGLHFFFETSLRGTMLLRILVLSGLAAKLLVLITLLTQL